MVATVKIIPFAVSGAARDKAVSVACNAKPLVRVAPYKIKRVGIISTVLPGLADKVIEKTLRVTAERLAPAGASIIAERRVPHDATALAKALDETLAAGAELVIIFGASAIADRRDVIPAAIEAAGGRSSISACRSTRQSDVDRLGRRARGAGRARLRALAQGERLRLGAGAALCGLTVTRHDIVGMGVGGLLMEIVTRPQPRASAGAAGRRVAAIVLAAGRSTRMGGPNKLLADLGGRPMVRIVVEQVLASRARPVIVITGHQRDRVEAALSGLAVTFVDNPNFADGLSTSLEAGCRGAAG